MSKQLSYQQHSFTIVQVALSAKKNVELNKVLNNFILFLTAIL